MIHRVVVNTELIIIINCTGGTKAGKRDFRNQSISKSGKRKVNIFYSIRANNAGELFRSC